MPATVTIYHNPKCGTSRKTLELIRSKGLEPEIVEYLKTGWTKPQLEDLLKKMKAGPRDILRAKEPLAEELGLRDPKASDAAILKAMIAHPVLVERPIVVTAKGAALGRPPEAILPLLKG